MTGRKKVSPRQQKKPRRIAWIKHILDAKGGPHEDRRNKRERQKEDHWRNEDWGE